MTNASIVARCRAAASSTSLASNLSSIGRQNGGRQLFTIARPAHVSAVSLRATSVTPAATFSSSCSYPHADAHHNHHQRRFKSSILRKPNERYAPGEVPKDKAEAAKLRLNTLLQRLQKVDTAALCDADKAMLARRQNGAEGYDSSQSDHPYVGLRLMDSRIRPRNYFPGPHKPSVSVDDHPVQNGAAGNGGSLMGDADGIKMIGLARTVQCTRPNDILAVLRGLNEAKPGEVLVVNTLDSTRAVAGGMFCAEAARKGLGGIVVDGYVRDVGQISKFGYGLENACLMYSAGVTPYAGTVQSIGEIGSNIIAGGVRVSSGDIIVGDGDGILVGTMESFEQVIDVAENIVEAERNILKGISQGVSLMKMCNYDEHIELRKNGKESALDWRKTRLVTFNGVEHVKIE